MLLRALEFAQCLRTIKQMSQTIGIQVVGTEYVAISPLYIILGGRLMAAMRQDDVILLATWHSC